MADDLSVATASGLVPLARCDANGATCSITNVRVSFSLRANGPVASNRGKTVSKLGNCLVTEKRDAATRTANGGLTINGTRYQVTTQFWVSTIDKTTNTYIYRNCSFQ